MIPTVNQFWLIQRLQNRNPEGKTFDELFGLDYMGSAEYEFNTPFQSLKSMRAEGEAVIHAQAFTEGDAREIVYFVAEEKNMANKVLGFQNWLRAPLPKNKERPYFQEHLAGTSSDYMNRIVAWWAFDANLMWTLDPHVANRLVAAVNHRKEA